MRTVSFAHFCIGLEDFTTAFLSRLQLCNLSVNYQINFCFCWHSTALSFLFVFISHVLLSSCLWSFTIIQLIHSSGVHKWDWH